jgi:hypothetical protein
MSNEIQSPSVETAEAQSLSDISVESSIRREIPAGENIVDAMRNAIEALNIPAPVKILGLAAVVAVVPGAGVAAVAGGIALLIEKYRRQKPEEPVSQ